MIISDYESEDLTKITGQKKAKHWADNSNKAP